MAKPKPATAPSPEKIFPVSWDQFHRDSRALAWRLHAAGPFEAIVCITRGGLVPAAIVARELNVRIIETVCIFSYQNYNNEGELKVLKGIAPEVSAMRAQGKGVLIVDDLVDTGKTARVGGRWSTPSSPRCRRTPGSIFPGTPGSPSSRRSARAGIDRKTLPDRLICAP
jgi:hypothetical protein